MRSGKRNKNAGHSWELTCIKKLREVGFDNLGTSRNISRTRDSQKVDICHFDEAEQGRFKYNIQCKNLSKAANYPKFLSEMPDDQCINVIFHKQTKKVGTRFMPMGEYALLNLSDFIEMMRDIERYKECYSILMENFDYIPDEEVAEVNSKLEALGL